MITYDVFLSHASDDKPEVEALARCLREDGLEPFLDKWHLIPPCRCACHHLTY